MSERIRIFLIEDDEADAFYLQELLGHNNIHFFTHVLSLSQAKKLLIEAEYDIILLDLTLAESSGIETLQLTLGFVKTLPIIVLTGLDDEAIALQAVREGAQDYLVKGSFGKELLLRAMRYAIERKRMQNMRDDVERIMRHDLKNPIASMISFIRLVKMEKNLSEMLKKYIDVADETASRMLTIIDMTQDLYRMEMKTYSPKFTDVDLLHVIAAIKKDRFIKSSADSIQIEVFADGKFVEEYDDTRNDFVIQGEEVPLSMMIQKRFFDKYVSGKKKGLGLGTYYAKLIAQLHGGSIRLKSTVDCVEVEVKLPCS